MERKAPVAANYSDVIQAIEKTGFPLEHRTAAAFTKRGWNIVTNKYYVDDNTGEAREIDLIAYKAFQLDPVLVYSAVIISCKKTSENTWVFLTRPLNPADPNKDLTPLHYWTNDKALSYSMAMPGFVKSYTERLSKHAHLAWRIPEKEVFAFQELSPSKNQKGEPNGYKLGNDKVIFSSITSLMKAQAYELGRLPVRSKTPVVYVFSLLSVMEGRLLEANYQEATPNITSQDSFKYVAHYIINKKEQYCRMNFIHPDLFEKIIKEYDAAHRASVAFIKKTIADFYADALENESKRRVFKDAVIKQAESFINIFGKFSGDEQVSVANTGLAYDKNSNTVTFKIASAASEEDINNLNTLDHVVRRAKMAIKASFLRDVNVKFESDIPF